MDDKEGVMITLIIISPVSIAFGLIHKSELNTRLLQSEASLEACVLIEREIQQKEEYDVQVQ
jgi:hypothetical protein